MTTANHLAHFAIHADDLARAQAFYGAVFGWQFRAWGPPDFFMITTAEGASPGPLGSLVKRETPLAAPGGRDLAVSTFECTIAVASIDETAAAITAAGGRITMKKVAIRGVGELVKFRDTEGNLVCAMQYESGAG